MSGQSRTLDGKLTRDELVGLVRRVMEADGTEDEIKASLRLVQANVEHPAVSDLIFWPDQVPGFGNPNPTAEDVVDFALGYQRRILPRDNLVRIVQGYMHPRELQDNDQDAFALINENLPGFEINYLTDWGRRRGLTAAEVVDGALDGTILADPEFQRELADDLTDDRE